MKIITASITALAICTAQVQTPVLPGEPGSELTLGTEGRPAAGLANRVGDIPAATVRALPNQITLFNNTGAPLVDETVVYNLLFAPGVIRGFPAAIVNGVRTFTQANVKALHSDGSVQRSLVAFNVSLAPGAAARVAFLTQVRCNCDINSAIPYSVLAGGNSPIQAALRLTGGTVTQGAVTIDALTMLRQYGSLSPDASAHVPRYTMTGPLATRIEIEDRTPTRRWDVAFRYPAATAPTTNPYSGKDIISFHPRFIFTIIGRNRKTRVEVIGENGNINSGMTLQYALSVTAWDKTYTNLGVNQRPNTSWRRQFWSPGSGHTTSVQAANIWTDYNLEYLKSIQVIPNYDTSIPISAAMIRDSYERFPDITQCSDTPSWAQIETDPNHRWRGDILGIGQFCARMASPGARPEIAVLTAFELRFLMAMQYNTPDAHRLLRMVIGNAEAAGALGVVWRENVNHGRPYVNGRAESSFGRFVSLDTRPTVSSQTRSDAADADSAGWPNPSGPGDWMELAHNPGMGWVAALLTGDDYLIELQQAIAAYTLTQSAYDQYRVRNPSVRGVMIGEPRGIAWGFRSLARAAYLSPLSSPEGSYFRRYLNTNLAVWEGRLGVKGGSFADTCPSVVNKLTTTSPYCWGAADYGPKYRGTANPLGLLFLDYRLSGETASYNQPWMNAYITVALGHATELGFPARPLTTATARPLLHMLLDPGTIPQVAAAYIMYVTDDVGNTFTTAPQLAKANRDRKVLNPTIMAWGQKDDPMGGYPNIIKAASAYVWADTADGLRGSDAWDLLDRITPHRPLLADSPSWAIRPRGLK